MEIGKHYIHQGFFSPQRAVCYTFTSTTLAQVNLSIRELPFGHEIQLPLSFTKFVLQILNSINNKAEVDQ